MAPCKVPPAKVSRVFSNRLDEAKRSVAPAPRVMPFAAVSEGPSTSSRVPAPESAREATVVALESRTDDVPVPFPMATSSPAAGGPMGDQAAADSHAATPPTQRFAAMARLL